MRPLQRRSFLQFALAAFPGARLIGQATPTSQATPDKPTPLVPAGQDRTGTHHAVGVSQTTYKVLTADTAGTMFVMEQHNQKHGGPSLHLHHGEDELFYVMEGEYIVVVGDQRFNLKAGDCVLGPKRIPHAWAFVGPTTGRMLLTYAPANKMEAFFNEREKLGIKPGAYATSAADAEILHRFGMELVGPPIAL